VLNSQLSGFLPTDIPMDRVHDAHPGITVNGCAAQCCGFERNNPRQLNTALNGSMKMVSILTRKAIQFICPRLCNAIPIPNRSE
jgi:hypothetical protein